MRRLKRFVPGGWGFDFIHYCPMNTISIATFMAAESRHGNASHSLRNRKRPSIWWCLEGKKGKKKPQTANRNHDKDNHKECK